MRINVGSETKRTMIPSASGLISARIFVIEGERDLDEHIDRRFSMTITEKLQHLHTLLANHFFAHEGVTELSGGDGDERPVAEGSERTKEGGDVARCQIDNDIRVFRVPEMPVRANSEAARDKVPNPRRIECLDDLVNAVCFHG